MSRLTALGWLAFYLYNDAAPTALRWGHAALSHSTFFKPPALPEVADVKARRWSAEDNGARFEQPQRAGRVLGVFASSISFASHSLNRGKGKERSFWILAQSSEVSGERGRPRKSFKDPA